MNGAQDLTFFSQRFVSGAEFESARPGLQDTLDGRWSYEQSMATSEPKLDIEGACGLCLVPACFTSNTGSGDMVTGDRRTPNWRESQFCDCRLAFNCRQRAVMQFIEEKVGLRAWTRALVFGPPERMGQYISPRVADLRTQQVLARDVVNGVAAYRLTDEDQSRHVVLSVEYLNRLPPLKAALQEVFRVLVSGGRFVFTVPFRLDAYETRSNVDELPRVQGLPPADFAVEVNQIGWDILDQLRAAGFQDAAAYLYWSEEFGYLGPYNFIFSATR